MNQIRKYLIPEINEIEGKIPSFIGLGTTSALNAVEIPSVSDLVKKTDYDPKNVSY